MNRFAHVLMCLLVGTAAGRASEPAVLSGRAMGTTWVVKYVPAASLERDVVLRRVAERLETLEQQFSTYRADSELARFNARDGTTWVPVSPEMVQVARLARAVSELTGGAFDATVLPLVQLWGFGPPPYPDGMPTAGEIDVARARVDWRRLEVRASPPALRKTRGDLAVDFSSVAKGFACDELSSLLRELGVRDHFLQIGGDVKTSGRVGGGAWRTGIAEPSDTGGGVWCTVELTDGAALSTSGDYRNFFIEGGRRYSHLIDPRTGMPASGSLAAVSVVHASCAQSSALATGLFVLGAEEGIRVAQRERLACLFIVRKPDGGFAEHATAEFDSRRRRE